MGTNVEDTHHGEETMKKLLLLLAFVGMAHAAHAGEANLTLKAPTQNCDGSPLTDLSHYVLVYGPGPMQLDKAVLEKTITGLTPGQWHFHIAAVNAEGKSSSVVTVDKVVTPEEFVTRSDTVYTVVKRVDRFVLTPVGTAPVGTQCVADQNINGMYVVPRSAVQWSGSQRPDVVVASCQ
jgi:hypothetical protein